MNYSQDVSLIGSKEEDDPEAFELHQKQLLLFKVERNPKLLTVSFQDSAKMRIQTVDFFVSGFEVGETQSS